MSDIFSTTSGVYTTSNPIRVSDCLTWTGYYLTPTTCPAASVAPLPSPTPIFSAFDFFALWLVLGLVGAGWLFADKSAKPSDAKDEKKMLIIFLLFALAGPLWFLVGLGVSGAGHDGWTLRPFRFRKDSK